jgi:hypothetical protein
MTDEELERVFNRAYQLRYHQIDKAVHQFYDKARDKLYALKLGMGLSSMLRLFSNGNLDKKITEFYDHNYKLGGSIVDVIRAIPEIKKANSIEEEERAENTKNEVSMEYDKFLGIPYRFRKASIKMPLSIQSSFEILSGERELAIGLGKQRAIVDFHSDMQAKVRAFEGQIDLDSTLPKQGHVSSLESELKSSLAINDIDSFFKLLQGIFATVSYNMKLNEGYFHSHIQIILTLLGFNIESEIETNVGRIDSVIETDRYIHIIEFKQNNSDIALEQIMRKEYYQRYFLKEKQIILIGVAVDVKKRNIVSWKTKEYSKQI